MTKPTQLAVILLLVCAWSLQSQAQFSSGSDGSDGALDVAGSMTLALPPDGIFNFSTVTIQSGATLSFEKNALNTPVYVLATGDIIAEGDFDVSANRGNTVTGGASGPGGFNGGAPGIAGGEPGSGLGPGAGGPGIDTLGNPDSAGSAAYGSLPVRGSSADGEIYGSPLLVPLVGGSGGGGAPNAGGCGGGGAILLASDTRIEINSFIRANNNCPAIGSGFGSGGGVRLVAPVVAGTGQIIVNGGEATNRLGGDGRVRIDLIDRSELADLRINPASALSVGAFMTVFTDPAPRLDIIEAAGEIIAEGATGPVEILLPFNTPSAQVVVVQARDFTGILPIRVVITPDSGEAVSYDAAIDMNTGDPATTTVDVNIPQNIAVKINAWTR